MSHLTNFIAELTVVNAPVDRCNRCGGCCEFVAIPRSPAQLRAMQVDSWPEGRMIAEMFAGRCRGRLPKQQETDQQRYVYGPCRNLAYEHNASGELIATCTVHATRPWMCSGFPYYDASRNSGLLANPNPAYIAGCGYNDDPTAGWTPERFRADLQPLDEEEK